MLGPTKTQSILHELITQIPLVWNYENCLRAYWESRRTRDDLETGVDLKLFERKIGFSKFVWKLESWELNLRIGNLETKFERD